MDYHIFESKKQGIVKDIRLDKLEAFAKLVERESNKRAFSFYNEKARSMMSDKPVTNIEQKLVGTKKYIHDDKRYLLKKFGESIDEENDTLLCINRNITDDKEILRELSVLAQQAFIIGEEDHFSDEMSLELAGIRDQVTVAINEKRVGKVNELIKTYYSLAESFLILLNDYGGGYTHKQAQQEVTSITGGWKEIEWLREGIREMLIKAFESHDQEIMKDVAYAPFGLAIRAAKFGDQYIFQEFIRFTGLIYRMSYKEAKHDLKLFMIDLSWRYIKELSDFYIQPKLRESSNPDEIKEYSDFSLPIFSAFQDLLKEAFDKKDLDSFRIFLKQLQALFKRLKHENIELDVLESRANLTMSSSEKAKAENELKTERSRIEAAKEILARRQQLIFGLSAWILSKCRQNQQTIHIKEFYEAIEGYLPNDIKTLTELFISVRNFETEHLWNWENWEMVADGEVYSIDFDSKLDQLYCVKALQILRSKSTKDFNDINLPTERAFTYLSEEPGGRLQQLLTKISENPNDWSSVLSNDAVSKVDALKQLLRRARQAQIDKDEQLLQMSEIDPDKVSKFRSEFLESFNNNLILRPIAKKLNSIQDLTPTKMLDDVGCFGYNQIDDKAAFVSDWHVSYPDWGERYGEGLAMSEDHYIFGRMVESLMCHEIHGEDVIKRIQEMISSNNVKDVIILESLDYTFKFKWPSDFIPQYRSGCPETGFEKFHGYEGCLKVDERYFPMFHIDMRDHLQNKLLILSKSNFGLLRQYSPMRGVDDEKYKYGQFYFKITDLNKDDQLRDEIIANDPKWLKEYNGDKDAILRQKVVVNLHEKLSFDLKDSNVGWCMSIIEADHSASSIST